MKLSLNQLKFLIKESLKLEANEEITAGVKVETADSSVSHDISGVNSALAFLKKYPAEAVIEKGRQGFEDVTIADLTKVVEDIKKRVASNELVNTRFEGYGPVMQIALENLFFHPEVGKKKQSGQPSSKEIQRAVKAANKTNVYSDEEKQKVKKDMESIRK